MTPTTVSTGLDFIFQVKDTGSTAKGSVILDQSPNPMSIKVIPLNDALVLTRTDSNSSVTENASTASGKSLDPVAAFTGSITVSFTDAYVTGDVLFINAVLPARVTVSGGTANGLTMTLGTATTVADVNSMLATISYKSTSDNRTVNDSDNTRNYQIVVNDSNNCQGLVTTNVGGAAALDSNIISGKLTITRTNDAPVVALNGSVAVGTDNAVTWTENSNAAHTAVAINPNATVTDTDNTNMTQLVMQVGGVQYGNNKVLNIGGVNFMLNTTVSNMWRQVVFWCLMTEALAHSLFCPHPAPSR